MAVGTIALSYLSQSMRRKVVEHAPLPLLNWTTVRDIRATVFEVCTTHDRLSQSAMTASQALAACQESPSFIS